MGARRGLPEDNILIRFQHNLVSLLSLNFLYSEKCLIKISVFQMYKTNYGYQEGRWAINWDIGIDIYTL